MDLERLINEVYVRPAIWDQKNTNYHNRDIVTRMWGEIAKACEVSSEVAKSKWKHLRDNFRNELKKSYKIKTDEAGTPPIFLEHQSKWIWFKTLLFLRDQMNPRVMNAGLSHPSGVLVSSEDSQIEPHIDILEGHDETQFDEVDADSCQSLLSVEENLQQVVMPPPKKNKVGRKRHLSDNVEDDLPEAERRKFERSQGKAGNQEEEDDTYHFLMSIGNPLRSLPLDRQMFLRLKIQELIFNEIYSQNQSDKKYHTLQNLQQQRTEVRNVAAAAAIFQNCSPDDCSSNDAYYN
ncbi:uncharacterized protein LOC105698712 [Orussus abietinus]|uniref:uncharacterized protein LOC105698712 n=1 Tax=Orussus abietinus TaxID=222816 RepID=UPI000625F1C5|nr:uncharacterized protein LOC105698712 [Orussus abietinus]